MRRWRDDLGLTEDPIIETALETGRDHPAPPDGPEALDRAMERATRHDAQKAAKPPKPPTGKRQRSRRDTPCPSEDERAAFCAEMVNSDRYLPANTVSYTLLDAMLARGLVTPERLRLRGVR